MPDPITRRGYDKLREKLTYLETEELPKQERALAEARERGDLSENAEYDAAREHVWEVERQIADLRALLGSVEVTELPKEPTEVVFGTRVTIRNLTRNNAVLTYEIVGQGENDTLRDRISVASPIAQALLGRKPGETAEVQVPAGRMKIEVLKVEPLSEAQP